MNVNLDLKRFIASNALLTIAYFLCAELTTLLSLPSTNVMPLWLPAGLTVAAACLWGYSVLPGVLIGAALFIGLRLGEAFALNGPVLLFVAQAGLLAITAKWLLNRFNLWPAALIREQQILLFFLLAAIAATLLPSLFTTYAFWQLNLLDNQHLLETGLLNWLGMSIGVILACPVLMSLFATPRRLWQPRIITIAAPMILLFILTVVALGLIRDKESNLSLSRFDSSTSVLHSLIQNELAFHFSMLQSIQAYFHHSRDVTNAEFQDFVQDHDLHQDDLLQFIWARWLPDTKQLNIAFSANLSAAEEATQDNLIGQNLCIGKLITWCQSAFSAYQSNLLTLPYPLDDDETSQILMHGLMVKPAENQENNQIRGMLIQVVDYKQLFSQIEKTQGYAAVNFAVTDLSTNETIFDNTGLSAASMAQRTIRSSRLLSNHHYQWRIDYIPSKAFIGTYSNWRFYWVVAMTLALNGLIGIWLMTMTGRYKLVENEVEDKTKALNEHAHKLIASEAKYRRLVENIQDEYILYLHDLDGFFTYVSPSVETILGYKQQEFLTHYDTFMPNTELNWRVEQMTAQTLSGKKSNYEIEIWSKAGELHTLVITEIPSLNEAGEIIGVEGIARDITTFKDSLQKLEKLSLAVEHSPNAVLIMDKFGKVEYVNPKFTALTGYENDENLGRWPDVVNSGTNNPAIYHEIWRTLRAGQEWSGELQNRKKNGELYWAQELIAPMLSEDGYVTHFVATQTDITEVRRLSEQTSYQASHDQLTGLINRHEFDLRLKRVILAAKHNLTEHALCFLDLDQFKVINDTCGHLAGDELLRQIGGLLQGNIRSRDTIARLGGDEFAILMEHCNIDQAYKACEQILSLLQDYRFHWQDYTFTIGASIGLAIVDQHTRDTNEALRHVDTACYSAKDAGRNRIEVHREDSIRLQERRGELQWNTLIGDALDHDRFLLYVQPIKPLLNPDLGTSYEVLVRMLRKDGEISPPGAFLPAAERYNSVVRIDRWVITKTLQWLIDHADALGEVAFVSVNLSGLTLSDETVLNYITEQLESGQLPAHKLKFEITETAAIANLRAATLFIEQLSQYGVRFALDDFGSGLSSFAYLKKLKVDALKIDGMFVKDMLNDPLDYEMVKSINDIGHVMGLHTIAEFVEDERLIEKLKRIGIDYVQGYAVGRPIPIDDLLPAQQRIIRRGTS